MALSGLRPVVEIMFGDFVTLITDQVVNGLSKYGWMYGGALDIPIVIRTPMGGRRLRTWLLRQKQVNSWESTRATADAVYALLLRGTNWLNQEREVVISLGNYIVGSESVDKEAGSGYMKERIEGKDIRPQMGNISVSVNDSKGENGSPSWGAVYWQYFEEIDKVSSSQNSLQVERQLMI